MITLKTILKRLLNKCGYAIINLKKPQAFPVDFLEEDMEIIRAVENYTMTGYERIYALIQAVKYIVKSNIPGDIVECGVWRGGSILAIAKTLLNLGSMERNLYLFDTFEGMPKPSGVDVSFNGTKAFKLFEEKKVNDNSSSLYYASLEEVKDIVLSSRYDKTKIHFIKGKVEDTLPDNAPEVISLLRLDTDWYVSTMCELVHLFPRLSPGGVIIIDDYGHWLGARKATDEYISQNNIRLLLNRIDYSGRIGVKI
jgi:hypothetical protein